jgi:hypothetical protein
MSTPLAENTEVSPQRPWQGLSSFTEQTQAYFFGREREITELLDRIRAQPLTVLFGLSGRGKTSLLGAGVLPRLRETGARPVILRLRQDGASFVEQLRRAWDQAVGGDPSNASLWERGHRKADRTALQVAPPVLILDQFEEVFTLGQQRSTELQALFRELACLVENRVPADLRERLAEDEVFADSFEDQGTPARVVVTLREDFLAQLEGWKGVLPSLMRNRMVLNPLSGPQALEAVVQPGKLNDPALVDAQTAGGIVRFVAQVSDETALEDIEAVPPLLSLLCFELNEARLAIGAPAITRAQLDEQKTNILQNFYARCFAGLSPAVRDVIESTLIVSESGHRNACTEADLLWALEASGLSTPDAQQAVTRLVNARLLTQERAGGTRRIELTHDLLAPLVVRSRNERRDEQKLAAADAARQEAQERTQRLLRERRTLRLMTVAMAILAAGALAAMWYAQRAEGHARASQAQAEKQTKQANLAKEEAARHLASALDERRKAEDAQSRALASLKTAKEQTEAAQRAERLTARTLALAQQNVDEVLTTLESPAMDEVHGFHRVEEQLLSRLVPLEQKLAEIQGEDKSPAGVLRAVKLDLRTAGQLLAKGQQVEAAHIYQRVFRRIAALPQTKVSPELREHQFECLYRLDRARHLLKNNEYNREESMQAALELFQKTRTASLSRFWREGIAQQVANYLTEKGNPKRALELLESARADLDRTPDNPSQRLWRNETHIVLNAEIITTKKALGREKEAQANNAESTKVVAKLVVEHPYSRSLTRHHLFALINQINDARWAKDEANHEKLAAEAERLISKFKGSEPTTFEAAEAQLMVARADFARWAKNAPEESSRLSRSALEMYGRLYAGRSVELPSFDIAANSLQAVINSMELAEQNVPAADLANIRVRHGKELINLSEPFLPCARALGSGAECNELIRNATKAAAERLKTDPATLSAMLAQRRNLFVEPAISMFTRDQNLPGTVPLGDRASTDPLFDHCAAERDYGKALLAESQVRSALMAFQEAVVRCEPWANKYDFDFYLRDSVSGLMVGLAEAQRKAGDEAAARTTLNRCWGYEYFACQQPYAEMVAQGVGGTKNEVLAVEILAPKLKMKRFTVPVHKKGGSELTFPFHVYIWELSDKRRYKGIEDQAIWLERNRGLVIPQDVRTSFIKLEGIARENKVSFPDLAVYALGNAAEEAASAADVVAVRQAMQKSKFVRSPAVASDEAGVALGGGDVLDAGSAGLPKYYALWNGAIWLFKSENSLNTFLATPEQFSPAFGGFCTEKLATGLKEGGNTTYSMVHEDRKFLACSPTGLEVLKAEPKKTINAATVQWKLLRDRPVAPELLTPLGKKLLENAPAENPKTTN